MDTILWNEESDRFTKRALDLYKNSVDHLMNNENKKKICSKIATVFVNNGFTPRKMVDIGCAYGGTIHIMSSLFPKCSFLGVDPGVKSIKLAKKYNSDKRNVEFKIGTSDALPCSDGSSDSVLLLMVLQWIPRRVLIKTIAEIDRVLTNGGCIALMEFQPDQPIQSPSIHNRDVFVFKDAYEPMFTVFPWYHIIYSETLNNYDNEDFRTALHIIRKRPLSNAYSFKKSVIAKMGRKRGDK